MAKVRFFSDVVGTPGGGFAINFEAIFLSLETAPVEGNALLERKAGEDEATALAHRAIISAAE